MQPNGAATGSGAGDTLGSCSGAAKLIRLEKPPRRILFFGKSMARTKTTGGLVEAMRRQGLDVCWLNMAKLRHWIGRSGSERYARRVFESHRPDLVVVFCQDLPKPLLDDFADTTAVVLWVETALKDIGQQHVDYFARADVVFMTNPGKFEWLSQHGIHQTAFVLEGFSTTWHYPVAPPRSPAMDLVFIGNPGKTGHRAPFLSEVARHFDLRIYGAGWERWCREYPNLDVRRPVGPRGYRKLCASARIVLGLNQVNDDPMYFSNRTLFTLACRGFHLTHYVPGLETVFADGEHLVWYRNIDDCLTRIEQYLGAPERRLAIANGGFELVVREHQFDQRIRQMLEVMRTGILPPFELVGPPAPARPMSIRAAVDSGEPGR